MNRRGFLQMLSSAVALSAGGIALLEPEPLKTYFFPPIGGWRVGGNTLLTPQYIVNEALRVLEKNLAISDLLTWQKWDVLYGGAGDTVNIRVPARYKSVCLS